MSQRVSAIGRLAESLMSLRTFASELVEAIENQGYGVSDETIKEISSGIESYYEDVGGHCDYIRSLSEPDGIPEGIPEGVDEGREKEL